MKYTIQNWPLGKVPTVQEWPEGLKMPPKRRGLESPAPRDTNGPAKELELQTPAHVLWVY